MDTRKLSDRIKKREASELLSPSGHSFDKDALGALLRNPEVRRWITEMGPFMPVKRG